MLSTVDWAKISIGILSVEFTRFGVTKNREVVRRLHAAGYRAVACTTEWRATIYNVVFLKPEHFGIASSAALPPAVDSLLRHSLNRDSMRCKHDAARDPQNQSFQIIPPLV